MAKSPHETARAVAAWFEANEISMRALGMAVAEVAPGRASITMTVRPDMMNAAGACHGGYTFTLADTAWALATLTRNEVSAVQHAQITYVAPVRLGDVLTATSAEVVRRGRNAISDVTITNQAGEIVAVGRGASIITGGKLVPD